MHRTLFHTYEELLKKAWQKIFLLASYFFFFSIMGCDFATKFVVDTESLTGQVYQVKIDKSAVPSSRIDIVEGSSVLIYFSISPARTKDTDLTVRLTSARAGGVEERFQALPAKITFPAGSTSAFLQLNSVDDAISQNGPEDFSLHLSSDDSKFDLSEATIAIRLGDNESQSVLSFAQAAYSVLENAASPSVSVQLNPAASAPITVQYSLTAGTALVVTHHNFIDGSLTFAPGETTKTIPLNLVNNGVYDGDKTMILTLSNRTVATLGGNISTTVTIHDDDPALGAFSIAGLTGENDALANAVLLDSVHPAVSWSSSTNATSYDVSILANDGVTVLCSLQNTASLNFNFSSCSLVSGSAYKAKVLAKVGIATLEASNSPFQFFADSSPVVQNDGPVRIMKGSGATILQVMTASDSATRGTKSDSDPDAGDSLTISSITQGTAGGLVTSTSTAVTYTPANANFTGVDTFTYTVTDTHGATATATVTLHVLAPYTWTGKVSSNWHTAGNWCGSIVNNQCQGSTGYPNNSTDSNQTAIFDGTCSATGHSCNAVANAAVSAYGIQLKSDYSGTLTQNAGVTFTMGVVGYSQSAGSFVGGDSTVSTSSWSLAGGSYIATSGTTFISAGLNVSNSPSFNANSGTFKFNQVNAYQSSNVTPGNLIFNNITVENSYASGLTVSGNWQVGGDLNCQDLSSGAGLYNGTLILSKNLNLSNQGCWGSTNIKLSGNSPQTVNGNASSVLPSVEFASSSSISLVGSINFGANLIYTSGSVITTGSSVQFYQPGAYSPASFNTGSIHFNDVTINRAYSSAINLTGTLFIDGNLNCVSPGSGGNGVNAGTVELLGNFTASNRGCDGTSLLKFKGTNQSFTSVSSALLPHVEFATSGTLTLLGTISLAQNVTYTSGAVDASAALIQFNQPGAYAQATVSLGNVHLNNVEINRAYSSAINIVGNLYVDGNLSCSSTGSSGNGINNGTLVLLGNYVGTNRGCDGNGTLKFAGSSQTVTSDSTALFPKLEFAASGTVSLVGTINVGSSLIVTSGFIDSGTSTMTLIEPNSYASMTLSPGNAHFFNVSVQRGYSSQINLTGTLYVDNDLNCSSTSQGQGFYGGSVVVSGSFTATNYGCASISGGSFTMNGTGVSNMSLVNGSLIPGGTLNIAKTGGGSVVLQSALALTTAGQNLNVNSGVLNLNGNTLTVDNNLAIGASGTMTMNGGSYSPSSAPHFSNSGILN